jgi:flavoprotein
MHRDASANAIKKRSNGEVKAFIVETNKKYGSVNTDPPQNEADQNSNNELVMVNSPNEGFDHHPDCPHSKESKGESRKIKSLKSKSHNEDLDNLDFNTFDQH